MTSFAFGLIMFVCIVPVIIILYFSMYPRKWKNKAKIYGINNRPEFKNPQSEELIDIIVNTHNKQATALLIVICVISVILLFVPGFTIKMVAWTVFIYIALFAFSVPYILGNSEMKKYKKAMGIVSEKVLYADLKNVGNVHALNKPMLYIANISGAVILLFSFLCDSSLFPLKLGIYSNTYICTAIVGSIILTNLIILPIAFMADNARNNVISEDSDINANYNRSRKKIFSDMAISVTWISNIIAALAVLTFLFFDSEVMMLLIFGIYMLALMFFSGLLVFKNRALENKYLGKDNSLLEDDDDNWILGMFYFNPNDKRLNVEKRVGIGWTVNMAHPFGMAIAAMGIISIIASLLLLVWIVLMDQTPIRIINNNDAVICHHLRNEYTIKKADIEYVEYGNLDELKASRTAGTAMESIAKGKFKVNGENGCTLFLNPEVGKYIKIKTNDKTYYISDNTEKETIELYESLKQ